jgi:putative flippase GtrA
MDSFDSAIPTVQASRLGVLARMLGRHQLASVVSTLVDFTTMTLVVELAFGSAVAGTLAGAAVGAITNFNIGRLWIFDARRGLVLPQAARYAVVSGASAGLNALGEFVLHERFGVQYLLARIIVSVMVSLLWNFPMQRSFVFRLDR